MLPLFFREYAAPKGQGREYLENLASFFLAVAKDQGEEEAVGLVLGDDPALGPYLDVDLRTAPKTHAWLATFRQAAASGESLVVQKEEGGFTATVLPSKKGKA